MSYFKQFPNVPYDLLGNGAIQNVVDLHRSVRPVAHYLDTITEYAYYSISDGERPDIVSQRLYDNPEYYWTFFIVNDFLADGLPAWPMSQQQLKLYIRDNFEQGDKGYGDYYSGYLGSGVGQGNSTTIITKPEVKPDGTYQNNINSNGPGDTTSFVVGEKVTNGSAGWGASTIQGTITQINIDMNQIVVQSNLQGARIIDDKYYAASYYPSFTNGSIVKSVLSNKIVSAYKVYPTAEAPFYYYRDDDLINMRPATCPEFFGEIDGTNTINEMPFVSHRQHAISQNDERSKIRVISAEYIEQFAAEYMRLINI